MRGGVGGATGIIHTSVAASILLLPPLRVRDRSRKRRKEQRIQGLLSRCPREVWRPQRFRSGPCSLSPSRVRARHRRPVVEVHGCIEVARHTVRVVRGRVIRGGRDG